MKSAIPETPAKYDHTRVIERPDGCYWIDADTGEEYGPFASLLEAMQDMEYNAESRQPARSDAGHGVQRGE